MADEIKAMAWLTCNNGSLSVNKKATAPQSRDQAVGAYSANVQTVGTTYEQVAVGADIATLGWALFRNLDATNYVEIGVEVSAAFYPLLRLNATEQIVVRLAQGITFFAKANTAAVKLESTILNN